MLRTYAVARRRQLFGMEVTSKDRRGIFLSSLVVTTWTAILSIVVYTMLAIAGLAVKWVWLRPTGQYVFELNFFTPVAVAGTAVAAYFILQHFWGPPNRDPENLFVADSSETDVRIQGELEPDYTEPFNTN